MNETTTTGESILNKKDVAEFLKCSVRQIELMVTAGKLPKPFYFGEKSPRWRRKTLLEWLESVQPTNPQAGQEG